MKLISLLFLFIYFLCDFGELIEKEQINLLKSLSKEFVGHRSRQELMIKTSRGNSNP